MNKDIYFILNKILIFQTIFILSANVGIDFSNEWYLVLITGTPIDPFIFLLLQLIKNKVFSFN